MQLHRTYNLENTWEEPQWLLEKSINDITKFDSLSNSTCSFKKPRGNTTIRRLLQGIWLHTQKEDGAYTSRLRPSQRNHRSHNDAIWKHEKVRSPDGDTDYFDIVAGVLQWDTLAPYLFIIYLDNVFRTSIDLMKENGFKLAKERSRRYPTQIITDADSADAIAHLANSHAQAESLLHSLERAAGGHLKLVDKFTYLGYSISSNKNDVNTRQVKAWTAVDQQLVIWKSDLTDKIKRSSFQAAVVLIVLYGCTTMMLTKWMEKILDFNSTRMLWAILNKS